MERDDEALRAWTQLRLVHGIVSGAIDHELEAAGFGAADGFALFRLASAPEGRLRMGDLAARLSLAQSGATRVIDRLVERGWVAREIPPDNRRTTYAVLTDEGRAAFARFQPVYERAVQEHFAAALPAGGVGDLRRLLEAILVATRKPKPEAAAQDLAQDQA